MKRFASFFLLLIFICGVKSWDNEELEIFDLVEEINKNFYELMGIHSQANGQEIKRAFRNLSIVLHPDKNSAEDANIQFRNLVSVYEVLKDSSKREKYDRVLKDGLPNWKSALYYYRRMRKIGLFEGTIIIFIIVTIGQYIFAWAAYVEKKYTAEQVFGSKLKKLQKKNKNIDMDAIFNNIPQPSIFNTLPFQITFAIWNLPKTLKCGLSKANEFKEIALEKRRLEAEEAKRQQEIEEEIEELARARKEKKESLRKRKQTQAKAPEKTDAELIGYSQVKPRKSTENDAIKPVEQKAQLSGGFWTDEDLVELIRLVKKYPAGSSSRWETIAEAMNRSVQEVTFMSAKMKENGYRIPGQSDNIPETTPHDALTVTKKTKTKKTADIYLPETTWSQEQQRTLEAAITKYRKTGNADRWQKIANSVEGKTKEECLLRYKYLCELVRSQKYETNNIKENEDADKKVASESQSKDAAEEGELKNNINNDIEEIEGENIIQLEEETKANRKSKRKERRRRKDFTSDEDSDDLYEYKIN